jgi:hypothetical protein
MMVFLKSPIAKMLIPTAKYEQAVMQEVVFRGFALPGVNQERDLLEGKK